MTPQRADAHSGTRNIRYCPRGSVRNWLSRCLATAVTGVVTVALAPIAHADATTVDDGVLTYEVLSDSPAAVAVTGCLANPCPPSVTIPASVAHAGTEYAVTGVGAGAFFEQGTLTSVEFAIGSNVAVIGEAAFQQSGLAGITIPASVRTIGKNAFSNGLNNGSSPLASVVFESGSQLTSIEDAAFSHAGLTEIIIPANVETIGVQVFWSASELTRVEFAEPSRLRTIGLEAFRYSRIPGVVVPESVTDVKASAFADIPTLEFMAFAGNAPTLQLGSSVPMILNSPVNTIHYREGATGFDVGAWATFDGQEGRPELKDDLIHVSFDLNGHGPTDAPPSVYVIDDDHVIGQWPELEDPEYLFAGWSSLKDATQWGWVPNLGAGGKLTLYAQWVDRPRPADPGDPGDPRDPGDPGDPDDSGEPGDPTEPDGPGGDPSDPRNPQPPSPGGDRGSDDFSGDGPASRLITATANDIAGPLFSRSSPVSVQVLPNRPVTVHFSGLAPASRYVLVAHSTPRVLAEFDSDEDGDAEATFAVPADLEPGEHTLTLSQVMATQPIVVAADAAQESDSARDPTVRDGSAGPGEALADTGTGVLDRAGFGLALITVGGLLLVLLRPRVRMRGTG